MSPTTKKILITLAIGLVVVAVPGLLAFLDYRKVEQIRTETAALDKQRSDLLIKKNKIEPLRKDTKGEIATFLRKKDSLPTGKEAEEFVDKLAEFRQKAGIALWDLKYTATRAPTGPAALMAAAQAAAAGGGDQPNKYEYKIDLEARYHQLGYLLSQIEYWDRFIDIRMMKITGGGKVAEYGDVELEVLAKMSDELRRQYGDIQLRVYLELVTYYYPDPSEEVAIVIPVRRPPPRGRPGAQPAAAAAAAADPAALAALEKELIEEAKDEMAAGTVEEREDVLDRFQWPIERNAEIRNPFNPLEALTPKVIDVEDDPGDTTQIPDGALALTAEELAAWKPLVRERIGPYMIRLGGRIDSMRELIDLGTEETLLEASRQLESLKKPVDADGSTIVDETEDLIRKPLILIDDEIKDRERPIKDPDQLVLADLLEQLAGYRESLVEIERDLEREKTKIALGLSRKIFEEMEGLFAGLDYSGVREKFSKDMVPLAKGSLRDVPGVQDYFQKAEALDHRAGVRLEFIGLDVQLNGVLVDEEQPERSVFMIAGQSRPRSVGEPFEVGPAGEPARLLMLDLADAGGGENGDEPLTVYRLVFEYKGEEIPSSQLSYSSQLQRNLENEIDPATGRPAGSTSGGSGSRPPGGAGSRPPGGSGSRPPGGGRGGPGGR